MSVNNLGSLFNSNLYGTNNLNKSTLDANNPASIFTTGKTQSPMENSLKIQIEQIKKQIAAEQKKSEPNESKLKGLKSKLGMLNNMLKTESNNKMQMDSFFQSMMDSFVKTQASEEPSETLMAIKPSKKLVSAIEDADYNKETGSAIADAAKDTAGSMGGNKSGGYCYRGVKNTLRKFGVTLEGGSAYQAASQLSGNENFKEVEVTKDELSSLPAGAVVVYAASAGHEHGHISVALGNGQEASDFIGNQTTNRPKYRVFLPTASMEEA